MTTKRRGSSDQPGRSAYGAVATLTVGALLAGCSLFSLDELDKGADQSGDTAFSTLDSSPATDEGGAGWRSNIEAGRDATLGADGASDGGAIAYADAVSPADGFVGNDQDGFVAPYPDAMSAADGFVGPNDRDGTYVADSATNQDAVPSPTESGVGADGGVDGGAGTSRDAAGSSTWCVTHSGAFTFDCHDFDEGQPPQSGFTNHYYSGHFASVTSAEFAAGSSPSALLLSTPSLSAGAASQDEQFNDVVPFRDKLTLSFAIKIVNYDVNAPDVSLFRLSYQDGSWAASLDYQQRGANFIEQSALPGGGTKRATYPAAQPSPLDGWTNVDCFVDFKAHTLSLSYNGVAVISNQAIANPGGSSPPVFVQIGLNFLGAPAKPMLIYYDNILLNQPP